MRRERSQLFLACLDLLVWGTKPQHTLLFWERARGAEESDFIPDRTKAVQIRLCGGDDVRCQRRLQASR